MSFSYLNAQVTSLSEDFTTCISTMPSGWQKYSVTGNEQWQCSTTGYVGNGVSVSGYSGGNNQNEDWLISPSVNLVAYSSPKLSFWSRTKYVGAFIQVLISSNYSGSGNPNMSTWTALTVTLPTSNSDTWFLSDGIDLTAYKSTPFRLAFKYTSTTAAAATWRLDNVDINEGELTLPKKFVNAGQCATGFTSQASTFVFKMSSITGTFLVNAPSPFEISKDGINFSTQLSYTSAAAGINQTAYVRIAPQVADKVYRNQITFSSNGNPLSNSQLVLGTSLPDDKTLRMVNWNMRWFGDPNLCSCDTNLSRQNATSILKDLNADIYCLEEVVSISQLAAITNSLGSNYNYTVSPFGSGATSPSSGKYAGCQKLGYIYNTNKIQNIGTFGLLASTFPADTGAYYCFSSGRYPFILKAKLLLGNSQTDTVIFSNIHAKASSTTADYNRRVCSVQYMTDSLNALFPGKKIAVIGDFNDYLEGTNVVGQTLSPYDYLLNHGFTGITLPSKYPNQTTYVGSTNHIIDNLVLSNSLLNKYPDSTCFIFTEAEDYIESYVSTTSDHFPLVSYLKFNFPNAIQDFETQNFFSIVNPSNATLNINLENQSSDKIQLHIYDILGNVMFKKEIQNLYSHLQIPTSISQSGIYFVELIQNNKRSVVKWIVSE